GADGRHGHSVHRRDPWQWPLPHYRSRIRLFDMTVRTRSQLKDDADTFLPDNTSGEISPQDVRDRVKDLADSALLPEDGAIMDGDFSSNGLMTRTGAGTYGITAIGTGAGTVAAGDDSRITGAVQKA